LFAKRTFTPWLSSCQSPVSGMPWWGVSKSLPSPQASVSGSAVLAAGHDEGVDRAAEQFRPFDLALAEIEGAADLEVVEFLAGILVVS